MQFALPRCIITAVCRQNRKVEQIPMALLMDLKVRGQYGAAAIAPGRASIVSEGGQSFSQVFSAAYQAGETGYDGYFQAAAETYGVPADLLKAVGRVESNFNAEAVSYCGAQGVMQLMPATARSLGVTDSFDPAQNIMGGAKYLRQMLDRFDGDVSKALAAYNAGPGAVTKYGGPPPYTQSYVNKVLGYAGGAAASSISIEAAAPAGLSALSLAGNDGSAAAFSQALAGEGLEQTAYGSDDLYRQEVARLFLERILLQSEEETEELR